MGRVPIGDGLHSGIQSNLYAISSTSGQLLPNLNLHAGEVRRLGTHAIKGGQAFDLFEGEYLGKEKVAIKVIRYFDITPETAKVCVLFFSRLCITNSLSKSDLIVRFKSGEEYGSSTEATIFCPFMACAPMMVLIRMSSSFSFEFPDPV